MCLISIITPSYNQGAFIEKTIQSVLAQDYPHIEYRVMDGGSTDGTLQILNRYQEKLSYVSEKDAGQSAAIAKGFQQASGDIFYWLNSDDTLLPGAITNVMKIFQAKPDVALVYGQSHFIDGRGNIIGRYPAEPFDFERLALFDFIPQPSAFFRRTAYEAVNGLDQGLTYGMDYDLWIRLTKHFPTYYLPIFISNYRLHAASKTVDMDQALSNSKEILDIAYRHYHWAPANRLYGYYKLFLEARFKNFARLPKVLSILITAMIATAKYILLNRRIRTADLRQVNWNYIKKMGVAWNDLYRTY